MTNIRVDGEHLQSLTLRTGVKTRVGAAMVQVLLPPPVQNVRVDTAFIQVLLPPPPVRGRVHAAHLQTLVSLPYVVTMADEETPVQVLHTDSVWRSLQMKF